MHLILKQVNGFGGVPSLSNLIKRFDMAKRKKKYDSLKMQAGARRKAHFAAGGTTTMWRGRAATLDEATSKARINKFKCRDRVKPEDY